MRKLIITAGILIAIYVIYKTYQIAHLDKNLDTLVRNGAIVLDVRTKTEYEQGHINGAVNIPLSQLHTGVIPLDTSARIITCCSHGLRSVKAVKVLIGRGYKHVHNGGAWSDLEKIIDK